MAATMVGANLIASHVFNLSLGTPYKQATRESSMASNEDVEDESTDENILYDLTIHAEWKQENELFVR